MSTRRTFLKYSAAAGAMTVLAQKPSSAWAAQKKPLHWRLALAVPKTLPIWGTGVQRLATNIALLTNNYLNIQVYGAGELVPALATFDGVQSGAFELGHSASYYWQGKIPASPFFCAIPFGMDASCANAWFADEGLALWHELMQPFGVITFPCGSTGKQCTGWYRSPVNSPADLQGLKVRIPGLAGKVFAKAGAIPVLLPVSELFTSLATGVIDAVEWVGPYHDSLMGFSKAVNYYYGSGWHEPGSILELMINKKAWDSLGAELQAIVQIAVAETDSWIRIQFEQQNAIHYSKLSKLAGLNMLQLPQAVIDELRVHAQQVLAEIAQSNQLADRISESYFAFMNKYQAFDRWAGIHT